MDFKAHAAQLGMKENEYKELVRLFIHTSLDELSALHTAATANDTAKASELLHSFKGAAVNLGFTEFAQRGQALEALVPTAGPEILGHIQQLVRDILDLKRFL